MTNTPDDPTTALSGRPPVVDLATWQAARDELLVREKAHTREGDAIAAARRRLPMVEYLLHDGPWQRAAQRVHGPARHDALRPPRGVGGLPRGPARGP
ncbi:DUF899 family protein [Actinomadura sp. 3N407]|uniref:DUF899 family protein n=1 Tax=Actinomadura sp. 3N407 TaxID=3457423 RepID=UPI003FCD9DA5